MNNNKTKVLIFDTSIDGHHLEYIHNLYIASENKDYDVIFCIPEGFKQVKQNFDWPQKDNVSYVFLKDSECNKLNSFGRLKYAWKGTSILKRVCTEINPDKVFLISILQLLPVLPLTFFFRKEQISGIIYKIYLYCWKKYSIIEKIYESLRFASVKLSKNISRIFVLNDEASSRKLNSIWHCEKFVALPDPFQSKSRNILYDKPLLNQAKIKILHFGALSARKGTMDILDAIEKLCKDKKAGPYQFVFAGRINTDIKEVFYKLYNSIKDKCDIVVWDKFCSYDELDELCRECDIIIAPYKNVYSSSGVIGYAAKYHKPVIVPNDGLLGKLVRKYKLGIAVNNLNSTAIYNLLSSQKKILVDEKKQDKYIEFNSIDNFNLTIYNNI